MDFDAVRGDDNVVALYARSIRRADSSRPDFKLFAGHRGVGKTSELLRLKAMLEQPDNNRKGFIVVFCDVSDSLDVNDLDFPDLLVYIAGELQKQLGDRQLPGFSKVTTYLKKVWDEIQGLLSTQISLSGVEVEVGFSKLTTEFRNRPNARRQLREAVEQNSTSLLDAVNDLLRSAQVAALNTGYVGVVLIVDGLDKLVRRHLNDGATNTHDRLFIDRSEQLASLSVTTVYTVPISLIYSSRFGQLEQIFGEYHAPISMIRVRKSRDEPVSVESPGMIKLREMVEKRAQFAGITLGQAFDNENTLHYLCQVSGGHPRHLLMLLQSACNELDRLPITGSSAKKAVKKYANALTREVPDAAWEPLKAFKEPQRDMLKDEIHQQMLFLLFVFEYMNGTLWYEVNPVFHTIERFRS
ncbi:MAG TPA: hypothetical protein DCS31_11385 [Candidatus Competibacteraceae bacterium]|nr:hypothetical protein [Candidatus Competibacteraceae bacterium]